MSTHDILHRLSDTLASRRHADPETSYTAKMFAGGPDSILKKIGEECAELIMAAKDGDLFIEIKPKKSFVDQQAWTKAWQFCIQTGNQIAIVTGRPFINNKKARLVHPKRGSEMKKFDVLIWGDRP